MTINEIPILPKVQPMDPNLFALNWTTVFEVLITIVVLSFILERALALLFESPLFIKLEEKRKKHGKGTYKPLIAFITAAIGCSLWQFDALSIILLRDNMTILGAIITGGVVAGGSKGAIKLFRDVLGIKSGVYARAQAGANSPSDNDDNN